MSDSQSIVNFADFLDTPPGRYLLEWEQRILDEAVVDIFGYNALQLGIPQIDSLRENRMPLRCVALDGSDGIPNMAERELLPSPVLGAGEGAGERVPNIGRRAVALVSRFDELPFSSQSIDLLILPHVLEFAQDPHSVLREVDRVLVPEGQLVMIGFNPASLWGTHHWMRKIGVRPFLPRSSQLIALPRLKDWLKLLSFEVSRGRFGCYVPWARSESWISRWSFLEKAGDRWWPVLGSVYTLTAIKRVHGMRLVGLIKKRQERRALAPAAVAHRNYFTGEAATVHIGVVREAANSQRTPLSRAGRSRGVGGEGG